MDIGIIGERMRKAGRKLVEVSHVDGRTLAGELSGLEESANGWQIVLHDLQGKEFRLYLPAIRHIRF